MYSSLVSERGTAPSADAIVCEIVLGEARQLLERMFRDVENQAVGKLLAVGDMPLTAEELPKFNRDAKRFAQLVTRRGLLLELLS